MPGIFKSTRPDMDSNRGYSLIDGVFISVGTFRKLKFSVCTILGVTVTPLRVSGKRSSDINRRK